MPLTALAWNIEKFGVKYSNYPRPDYMENLRCVLIARVASAAGASVLVIQELRKAGVAKLASLVAQLDAVVGGNWHYDWLPGSLTTAVTPATLFSQLDFTQPGNSEGYAVLWRDNALVAFGGSTLSAGIDTPDPAVAVNAARARYLGMVFMGQPLLFNDPTYDITYNANGVSGALGFPYSTCPATNIVTLTRQGPVSSNAAIPRLLRARRPCCVQLSVANNRTVPLVVFHAPVGQHNSRSPKYGTLIGFASAQLQVNDCVYAGDFNVINAGPQASLEAYPATLNPAYGASTYVNNVAPRSIVHYLNNDGSFRTGAQVYGSARDYAFARAPNAQPALTVRNVLALDVTPAQGAVRAGLTMLSNVDLRRLAVDMAQWESGNTVDVFRDYYNDQPPRHGADANTAAAIVHRVLISDHLPVAINFA